jgi:hypothetical protein
MREPWERLGWPEANEAGKVYSHQGDDPLGLPFPHGRHLHCHLFMYLKRLPGGDPPLLVADVFTADFLCTLNDYQGSRS